MQSCRTSFPVWKTWKLYFLISEKLEAPDIISVEKIAGIKQLLNITWKNPMVAPERRLCCLIQYRKMHSNDSVSYIVTLS